LTVTHRLTYVHVATCQQQLRGASILANEQQPVPSGRRGGRASRAVRWEIGAACFETARATTPEPVPFGELPDVGAARVRLFVPDALMGRLEQRFSFLTGGARDAPARQRTLRATLAWSYNPLSADEQELFVRSASSPTAARSKRPRPSARPPASGRSTCWAASPGWRRRACSACRSRLTRRPQSLGVGPARCAPRVSMLATVRKYASEQLEASGEAEEIRRRHAEHVLVLVRTAPATRSIRSATHRRRQRVVERVLVADGRDVALVVVVHAGAPAIFVVVAFPDTDAAVSRPRPASAPTPTSGAPTSRGAPTRRQSGPTSESRDRGQTGASRRRGFPALFDRRVLANATCVALPRQHVFFQVRAQ
jgi:hypothetical protein